MCRAVPQIWIRVKILRIQGSRKWKKSISGWPLGFRVLRVSPLNRNVPIPIKMRGLSTLYDARFLRYRNTVFWGFSEIPKLIWNVILFDRKLGDRSRLGSFLWCSPILLVSSQKGPQAISEAPRAGEGQFSPSVFCPSSSIIHEIATRARQKIFSLIDMQRYSEMWLPCKISPKLDQYFRKYRHGLIWPN